MTVTISALSAPDIAAKKGREKIAMLTAYDFAMATLLDKHVDMLLVGDTLGCVVQGLKISAGKQGLTFNGASVSAEAA